MMSLIKSRKLRRAVGACGAVVGMVALIACAEGTEPDRRGDDDDDSDSGRHVVYNYGGSDAGGAGGSGQGGAGAGPSACTGWPTGTSGVSQGMTVPSTISWQGYAPGSSQATTISMQDLYDCDGTHGIDAILIDTSQYG